MGVDVNGRRIELTDGPRVIVAKRSDRSMDGFYNHDDKEAEKKKPNIQNLMTPASSPALRPRRLAMMLS